MTTVVVLSPHLDDAVVSLGGTMHLLRRAGISTRMVTLFAGDVSCTDPPSYWDAGRDLKTTGEVFRARRDEDSRAAEVLDVEYAWLPHLDSSYLAPRDPDELWSEVAPHLSDADAVLVPGWPLTHYDHQFVAALALDRIDPELPLLFFVEQPYASRPRHLRAWLRGPSSPQVNHIIGTQVAWSKISLDPSSRIAKERAMQCYAGEMRALGRRRHLDAVVARVLRRESIGCPASQTLPSFLRVG